MSNQLYINLDPDTADVYGDASSAVKDLIRRFDSLNKTVLKAERQLLKFDEINRLVAYEVKEKAASAGSGKSAGGAKSTGSKSTASTVKSGVKAGSAKASGSQYQKTGAKQNTTYDPSEKNKAKGPIYFTISDVLFNWDDLNWEQIMMKIIAGLGALGGAIVGGMMGGVPGAIIGLGAGLLFGIALDECIFNFDGELQTEEIWKSLLTVLAPVAGGIVGLLAFGPVGGMIGISVGVILSFVVAKINWADVRARWDEFFQDLNENFDLRWASFRRKVSEALDGVRRWWQGLNFGSFHLKLPHITVQWQELAADSTLARFLGITAIPHLSVEWYARGGIVDGPTLIGAGEAGKEAIIPLERNTFWIHEVAIQLKEELEKLAPSNALTLVSLPAAASGALVPPSSSAAPAPPDLSSLADTIAEAIASLGSNQMSGGDPVIRVYLDGKQLTDVVTKYQRRSERAFG